MGPIPDPYNTLSSGARLKSGKKLNVGWSEDTKKGKNREHNDERSEKGGSTDTTGTRGETAGETANTERTEDVGKQSGGKASKERGEGASRTTTSNDEEKPNKMATEEDGDEEEEVWEEVKEVKGKKKRKTNLESKTKSHTEKMKSPEFKFTAFVELNVFLPPSVPKADIFGLWEDTISEAIALLQWMDPSICLLLPEEKSNCTRIYTRMHSPKFFRTWKKFMSFEWAGGMGMHIPADKG